jgi:hypothetical protein
MKKILILILIVLAGFGIYKWAGNKKAEDTTKVPEYVGNAVEKESLIVLDSPQPNDVIESPLTIMGKARGPWYFEASFPIVLTDSDGLIIAEGHAEAQGEWMTEEFVPFKATLNFTKPAGKNTGSLILKKDNPSGLPEHDDALEIPIIFGE